MKIEIDFTPQYDEDSIQEAVKDAIVNKMTERYMSGIEKVTIYKFTPNNLDIV